MIIQCTSQDLSLVFAIRLRRLESIWGKSGFNAQTTYKLNGFDMEEGNGSTQSFHEDKIGRSSKCVYKSDCQPSNEVKGATFCSASRKE